MNTVPGRVGRPPLAKVKRLGMHEQASIAAITFRLNQEASMLRVVAARVVGKGERIEEVRQGLLEKSWELDKFAISLQELP